MRRRVLLAATALPMVLALGCSQMPGYPKNGPPIPPDQVVDFHTLYNSNCQACHGANGESGPAIDLANPEYQALVDDATLRKVISTGMPGTEMPAWAQSAGGMLTDRQIDAIVAGMRREWAKPNAFGSATPPPYAQPGGGSAQHGEQVYRALCASCHQKPGRQQLTSPVYLSLVSDQALRSIIVAGRPDIHQPDWRLMVHPEEPGQLVALDMPAASAKPLSSQDVTDIVAYLHSLRNPTAVSAAPTPVTPRR
ncbi:MAG: c-type cytochrome [Acidobacteriaceae bacterium]